MCLAMCWVLLSGCLSQRKIELAARVSSNRRHYGSSSAWKSTVSSLMPLPRMDVPVWCVFGSCKILQIDFASFRPLNPMFTSTFCINMPCESVVNLSINTMGKVVHKWPSAFFSYSARSFLATRWLVPARRVSSGSWPYVILSACHFSIDYVWQREKELTGYWQLVCKCFNWILRCLLYFLYIHIDSWKLGLLDIHSYKKIWYHPLSYWFAICCLGLGLLGDIGRRELEAAALQGEQTVWHRNDETYASQS